MSCHQPDLRPATLADESAVIALWKSCGLTADYNPPEADFRRALSASSSEVILAVEADQVVGSVVVGDDGHRAWVYYLGVAEPYRNSGLGRRLMQAAEDWATRRGARKLQLMIRPSNEHVRDFYERAGYAETPRVIMAKWLDKGLAAKPPADRG